MNSVSKKTYLKSLVAGSVLTLSSASQAALITNYTFDGNANDSAGSANLTTSGTTGAPTFSSTGASSQTGGSAVFSGGGNFNIASSKVFQNTPNFTVSFWVKPSSTSTADVIRQSANGPGGMAYLIDSNGYDAFVYGASGTSVHGNSSTLVAGAWANLIVTFADPTGVTDANGAYTCTATLYVNGNSITSISAAYESGGTSNVLGIGGRGAVTSSGGFVGSIDDFAVFNNVLSSSDIAKIAGGAAAASVPEPTAMSLLGLGSLMTLRRKRR